MQLVETVVSNAKFHSSQDRTSQYIVTNVFQSINQHLEEVQVAEDLVEEVAEDLVEEVALAEEAALTEVHEKCTKLPVEIVVKTVKFHSSQDRTSQYIVTSVFKVIKETRKYTSKWTK
jgi:RNAse (barnase) inhibitor barstar